MAGVSQTIDEFSAAGAGAPVVLAVNHVFHSNGDWVVLEIDNTTKVETVKTLDSDYTVTGASVDAGGTITSLYNVAAGKTFKAVLRPALTSDLTLTNNQAINLAQLNKRIDILTNQVQSINYLAQRSVRVPDGRTAAFDARLPPLIVADKTIAISTDGLSVVMGPSASDVAGAASAGAAATASAVAAAASAAAIGATAYSGGVTAAKTTTYNVVQGDNGKLIQGDATAGSFTINLPALAGVTLPFLVGFLKTTAANNVTFDPNAAELINGAATRVFATQFAGGIIAATAAGWVVQTFGELAAGSVTLATMANLAQDQFIGRVTASTGVPETATITAAARTVLDDTSVAAMRDTLAVFGKVKTTAFTSTTTWNVDPKMLWAKIECIGGGGGGGACDGAAAVTLSAAGGGAGQYSIKFTDKATAGSSQAVTQGAAGAAGATPSGTGGSGGTTSVGSICTAGGGIGGGGQASGGGASAGGLGGSGGTSDFASTGARGGTGFNLGATGTSIAGGAGGSSPFGGGGAGVGPTFTGAASGTAGTGFGAGGQGGASANNTGDATGGAGTAGLVYITEYLSQ